MTRRELRYHGLYQAIHWTTAILMVAVIGLGLSRGSLEPGSPLSGSLLDLHKSVGITILALTAFRLLLRAFVGTPALPEGMTATQRLAAVLGHATLYATLLYMPLTGYVSSVAGDYPFLWFGWFSVPGLLPIDKGLSHRAEAWHVAGQWFVYGVIALHVLATLWHQFVRKDHLLNRMLPFRRTEAL